MEQPSEPNNHRPAAPAAGPSHAGWGDLDSEFRTAGEDTPQDPTLPRSGFSWRFVRMGEPPADPRVRYAMPLLLLWVMVSGFWQGFVPWLGLGFGLAVYAVSARAAFRRYGLAGRGWVLTGMGAGQMLLSFALALNVDLLWRVAGLYWAVVLVAWAVVELRGLGGLWR
jgi:hypothetical protein